MPYRPESCGCGSFVDIDGSHLLQGLTGALSTALAATRERRSAHDPGRVLVDVAVMLADGGECVTDLDAYRG